MSRPVVIVDGIRTPFARAGSELREVPTAELGRAPSRELLARVGLDPAEVDEVIFGCVAQPSDSANVARLIAVRAGVPRAKPALTVGRNCGSGMEAVTLAAERIAAGRADTILAGGAESMSRIPLEYPLSFAGKMFALSRARNLGEKIVAISALRPRDFKPVIGLERGLTDAMIGEIMGKTAERLARLFGISREAQDAFAAESHRKAVESEEFLRGEIAPLAVPPRLRERVTGDVGPREDLSAEKLAKKRPYFDRRHGTVTVANSCGITDGGVALLVMAEEKAEALGLQPLGRLVSHAFRGCDPKTMGLGPVHASAPALRDAGISVGDLARVEINEAFAAQVLAVLAAFGSDRYGLSLGVGGAVGEIDPAILNVHGGAIALGHPVGASGARIILTLLRELRASGGGFGLASLCIGGGQGGAVVVEGRAA